jgi:microcin C transport system substrate-binding protein
VHTVAYWDRFSRPKVKAKYSLGFMDTWWIDAAKRDALAAAMAEAE